MRCKSIYGAGALILVISMLLFNACHQSAVNPSLSADDNGGYASDASRLEFATDDAISLADAAGATYNSAFMRNANGSRTTYIGHCASVGVDTNDNPHTLSINFGDTDCVCLDGRKRRGYIWVTYSGNYTDASQMHTISFDNYFVDNNQLGGTIQTWRVDTTVTGNWYYNVQVNDTMTVSNGGSQNLTSVWQGNLERRWIRGYDSSDRTSEVFFISGAATLTRANGNVFTMAIATPLQVTIGCNFIESGVIDVSSPAGSRRLDYGTGGCDQNANLYIGLTSYSIGLVQ